MRRALPDAVPEDWRRAAARVPRGVVIVRAGRPAEDLVAARLRAFGPGHVDHAPSRAQAAVLSRIVDGREAGPLLDCSRLAVISADAAVVGVALVTDAPAVGDDGGPWVADIYRDPDPRLAGLGTALLCAVMAGAVEAGRDRIGLAVTEGNPARRLYERLGFAEERSVAPRQ